MKRVHWRQLYWRPQKCSSLTLFFLCLAACGGLALVEWTAVPPSSEHHEKCLAAAQLADKAMQVIREERLRRGYPVDVEIDPAQSGMIGLPMSSITSVSGHLGAKQTSVNPNFAALVTSMLRDAGVGRGDCVAVGCSGSFPALNTAVCAALETLEARPIIIASAGASQYGANFPDLLWVDMERLLRQRGLISFRSAAASIGGYEDKGLGMTEEGRKMIRQALARNQLEEVGGDTFRDRIDERMEVYRRCADGRPIRAYINVGGGTISVGRALGKKMYEPGLNLSPPEEAMRIDSVMTRFARAGVPLVHLVHIEPLAKAHGFPRAPQKTPAVGEGLVYGAPQYNRWLAGGVLAMLLLGVRGFVLTDRGYRLTMGLRRLLGMRVSSVEESEKQPAWMV